jgi:hypothetical protein
MDGDLNVAALVIMGTFLWSDSTVTGDHYLCAGYVSVEKDAEFRLSLDNNTAYVFLKVRSYLLILTFLFNSPPFTSLSPL